MRMRRWHSSRATRASPSSDTTRRWSQQRRASSRPSARSGKTHLLDAIVGKLGLDATLGTTNRFVPIPVTFNGKMNGVASGVPGLLVRIVYAHFVGVLADKRFGDVAPLVEAVLSPLRLKNATPILRAVIRDVAQTHKLDVDSVVPVLLVDEIRLSGDASTRRAVYDVATEWLAGCPAIITSLDIETVRPVELTASSTTTTATASTTTSTSTSTSRSLVRGAPSFARSGSNKPIDWLVLPRIHTDDWEKDTTDVLLARLTAMAGGHPRTIANVRQVRREQSANAANIVTHLVRIARKDFEDFDATWQFLVPAATSVALKPNERFDESLTLERAAACGALQNTLVVDTAPLSAQVKILFSLAGCERSICKKKPNRLL